MYMLCRQFYCPLWPKRQIFTLKSHFSSWCHLTKSFLNTAGDCFYQDELIFYFVGTVRSVWLGVWWELCQPVQQCRSVLCCNTLATQILSLVFILDLLTIGKIRILSVLGVLTLVPHYGAFTDTNSVPLFFFAYDVVWIFIFLASSCSRFVFILRTSPIHVWRAAGVRLRD